MDAYLSADVIITAADLEAWEIFLAAPLKIHGATCSPLNPLAVF